MSSSFLVLLLILGGIHLVASWERVPKANSTFTPELVVWTSNFSLEIIFMQNFRCVSIVFNFQCCCLEIQSHSDFYSWHMTFSFSSWEAIQIFPFPVVFRNFIVYNNYPAGFLCPKCWSYCYLFFLILHVTPSTDPFSTIFKISGIWSF